MSNQTDYFVRGSDNIITMTLTEDGSAIASSPTEISIDIGDVTITRTPDGNGVSFAAGVLEITPGDLTETAALATLVAGQIYPVLITIKTAGDLNGVVFGAADSINKQWFEISDLP
jgi:hypothetical protein